MNRSAVIFQIFIFDFDVAVTTAGDCSFALEHFFGKTLV
jgi:hypothetical protein